MSEYFLKREDRIVVTSPSFAKNITLRNELLSEFPNSVFFESSLDPKKLASYFPNTPGAIFGLDKVSEELLNHCPDLKFIAKYGVGTDNIDFAVCEKYGVKIGWTGGVNRLSVAEQVVGFMLMLSRNLFFATADLKDGKWNKFGGEQLSQKKIGIIGAGFVGKELIRLLKPFQCEIFVNDILDQRAYFTSENLKAASKEEIFSNCDIVSLHVPLTKDTHHLVNSSFLGIMKKSSFLINTSRGPVVCQADLKHALQTKKIAGAAIDVYEEEPPEDLEFLQLPNLICSPHIAGNAKEAVLAMGRSAIQHLVNFKMNKKESRV